MRDRIVRYLFYLGLLVLAGGLFNVQILQYQRFKTMSEKNRIRLIPLEAPRGRVMDRQGRLLATNRSSYDVVATPEDITPEAFPVLARILKVPEKELRKRITGRREFPFAPAMIQEDVTLETVFKIEERKPELPGVSIRLSSLRYYPYEKTASHVIGFIGKVTEEEYARLDHERFGINSLIGRTGIEKIYDDKLRGWRGGRQIEVNSRGELVQVLSERIPEPGEDLIVTLDLDFQNKIMDKIKGLHASVAVLDLKTNGLLALASAPAYDPNVFVAPGKSSERLHFLRDKEAPLMDRGVSSAYPPGSVFKLVTALAGLELGKITANTRFHCPGHFKLNAKARTYHCWYKPGHGSLNLYEALERSCNVYFYNVGAKLSPEDISHYARELGLGERMSLELSNITPGLVPDTAWKKKRFKDKWYQGETLSFAIGQSYLLTSPLQIMRLTAIIANNGLSVEPMLVYEGNKEHAAPAHKAIHEENLKLIKRGMLNVVESDFGTGQLARVDFAKLAAKTGTAQVPPKVAHSWMTGFFPYENPEIAFVVFVEHGGPGGVTAAKIVKEVLKFWKEPNAPALA